MDEPRWPTPRTWKLLVCPTCNAEVASLDAWEGIRCQGVGDDERHKPAKMEVVHVVEVAEISEYFAHMSWRCEHPDRFPWDPDCRCGLTAVLRALELPIATVQNDQAIR